MGQFSIRRRLLGRVLTRPGPVLVVVLTLALGTSDWPWEAFNGFWRTHPVVANLATGVMFVAIAIAIIDAWHRETDELKWRRVGNIAYKALIQSVRASRDGLVMLIEGEYPFPDVAGERPAIEPNIVTETEAVCKGLDRSQRLDALMQRSVWVGAAYRTVRQTQLNGRRVLGEWAALMVASDRLAPAFDRVGLFTDAIEDLERPLYMVHRDTCTGAIADSARRAAAVKLWDQLITTAAKLEESLTREMGREDWVTRGREVLSARGVREIIQCDQGDAHALSDEELKQVRDQVRDQYLPAYYAARTR